MDGIAPLHGPFVFVNIALITFSTNLHRIILGYILIFKIDVKCFRLAGYCEE